MGEDDQVDLLRLDPGGGQLVRQPSRRPDPAGPGAPGPPTPVSTSTTRSRARTTKHQSRSRQRSGPPNAPGWRDRQGAQAAAGTWGKASARGLGSRR